MNIIYEPKGKAREYSPLAANFTTDVIMVAFIATGQESDILVKRNGRMSRPGRTSSKSLRKMLKK